jgi:hypothetical protein
VQLTSGHALGAARDENLPPGKQMNRVDWIEIPLADPFHLVVCNQGVQKELEITKEQLRQFRDMEPLFRSELRELSYAKGPETNGDIQQHIETARDGMGRILGPGQIERLHQLLLQLHGPCSVMNDPKLSSLLKISDQQARKMNNILHVLAAKSERIYAQKKRNNQQADGARVRDVAGKQKQMQQILQSLNREVYSLFSDEQKIIYKKAEGKPFEFKLEKEPDCFDSNQ